MHKPFCRISARHLYKQIMITDDAQKIEFAFMNNCLTNTCELVEVECYLQVQQKQLDNVNSIVLNEALVHLATSSIHKYFQSSSPASKTVILTR